MAVPKRKKSHSCSNRNYKNMINPKNVSISKMILLAFNNYLIISWVSIFKKMNFKRYQFYDINIKNNFNKLYFI
jgi:hypothetical protein